MAATGFEPIFEPYPTPKPRPWGNLLDVAQRVSAPDRWQLGVQFQPFPLGTLTADDVKADLCADQDAMSPNIGFTDAVTQSAFKIWDAVSCSALGGRTDDEMATLLEQRWPLILSYVFAVELLGGAAGSTYDLLDATDIGATATVQKGIAGLEGALAGALVGTQGVFHMSPDTLTYAVTDGTITLKNGIYYTPGGHLVAADAGYMDGESAGSGNVYASGPIYYDVSGPSTRGELTERFDRKLNRLFDFQDGYGVLIFNPEQVFSTAVTKA